jgi:hypothetical protein
MTDPPETKDLAPDRDLAPTGRTGLFTRGYWVMMALGAACIAAAAVVGFLGPRLWPVRTTTPAAHAGAPIPSSYSGEDRALGDRIKGR